MHLHGLGGVGLSVDWLFTAGMVAWKALVVIFKDLHHEAWKWRVPDSLAERIRHPTEVRVLMYHRENSTKHKINQSIGNLAELFCVMFCLVVFHVVIVT